MLIPGVQGRGSAQEPTVDFALGSADSIRCRIFPLSQREAMQYDRETANTAFKVLCAPTDSGGNPVVLQNGSKLSVGGVEYFVDGKSVERKPGTQGTVLVRAIVFREG